MKRHLPSLFLLLLAVMTGPVQVFATHLREEAIPSEAQWLMHLDVDLWRSTRTGSALLEEIQERKLTQFDESIPLDPLRLVNGLHALTVYGTTFDFADSGGEIDGVVILDCSPQLMQIVEGAIAAMEIEQPESIAVVQESPHRILSLQEQGYGVIVDEHRVALAKSLDSLRGFLTYTDNPGDGAALKKPMRDSMAVGKQFFLVATAEGINRSVGLPPQARILQLTEGATVKLEENEDALDLIVSLRTNEDRTARQVQQVLQGIIAMVSLAQTDDAEVAALLSSMAVSTNERTVHLGVSYPVNRAIVWVNRWVNTLANPSTAAQ